MEGGADMCFGVFRQPSAPCVSVGTAVCALSLKICIRLSVRVCMCVCVCVRNRKRRNNQLCVCVHASVSACVKSATLSICLNRGLLSQFSSLWTMLVLEGDRLHKLSLSRPHTHTHTHTHTLLTQCFYSHAESDAAVWRRATSQWQHNEAKRQRRGTNQPHQHVHITNWWHQQPAVTVIITTVFINIVSDTIARRCSEPWWSQWRSDKRWTVLK